MPSHTLVRPSVNSTVTTATFLNPGNPESDETGRNETLHQS